MFCVTYFCFVAYGCAYLWNSIVRMHTRKACKGTKIFSHTQVKTTKFLFLIFSSTSTPLFPYSLRPLSSSLFPRSPYPLFTPKSQYASTHSRHIPDTYPTHTRYIRISHEYPTNTLRIPHEYPTQKTAMREVEFSSPLAVLCTAVARRVFHASVRMVR